MRNDGIWIVNIKDIKYLVLGTWFILLPLFGGLLWIATNEEVLPAIIFVSTGLVITLSFYIAFLLNKSCYFFQIAIGFISMGYVLGLGSWLIFTVILSNALKNYTSMSITFIISFVILFVYAAAFFKKYHDDFNKNKDRYLKGIDFKSGIIDPLTTNFYNSKLEAKQIENSPFFTPAKIFLLGAAPLGAGGCGLLMRHIGQTAGVIVLAIAMYSLSLMMIVGGMHGYFSLYILAKLQIRHRKWFRLAKSKD